MKVLVVLAALIYLTAGAANIAHYYMFYGTNFTNNGGVDNSTCDISLAGLYDAAGTLPSGPNYAGFALIKSEVGSVIANSGKYSVNDTGIGCNVDYDGSSQSWSCRMITVTKVVTVATTAVQGIAFGTTIPVTDVIQSTAYLGAKLHLSKNMFPEIWNKSLAGPSQYVW